MSKDTAWIGNRGHGSPTEAMEYGLFGDDPKGGTGCSHHIHSDTWWEWTGCEPSPDAGWKPHPNPDDFWARYVAAKLLGKVDAA